MKIGHPPFGWLTYSYASLRNSLKSRSAPPLKSRHRHAADDEPCLRWTQGHAESTAVIQHEPESEPDEHRTRRSVESFGYGRSTQPARNRARGKRKQREPKDAFGRVNDCKQHTEGTPWGINCGKNVT
jgi:hypothetical protein